MRADQSSTATTTSTPTINHGPAALASPVGVVREAISSIGASYFARQPVSLLSGLISWFGGPGDPTSGSTTASGAPVTTPGIAVNNQATLGGWWLVKVPNGTVALVRQTDIGPAPSTGRTFDFLYSLLPGLGYSTGNFPTGSSASGVYIGKAANLNTLVVTDSGAIVSALTTIGATPVQQNTLIGELDTGAGRLGASYVAVSSTGKPSSDKSVKPSGDAASAGIPLPNLNPLSGIAGVVSAIFEWLTTPAKWLEILKFVGGALLVFFGLKSLAEGSYNAAPATKTRTVPVPV